MRWLVNLASLSNCVMLGLVEVSRGSLIVLLAKVVVVVEVVGDIVRLLMSAG